MGTCVSKTKIHHEHHQHQRHNHQHQRQRKMIPRDISYHGGVPKHMYHSSMSRFIFKDGQIHSDIHGETQWRRCNHVRYRNTPYLPPIPETVLKIKQ